MLRRLSYSPGFAKHTESIHPQVVQGLLGHNNISIMMDVYLHVLPSMHLDAISRLNTALVKQEEDGKNHVQA
jgi:integrase